MLETTLAASLRGASLCLALNLAVNLAFSAPALAEPRDLRGKMEFKGRYLVSVSDADMVASAYVNGRLGPREGADALSVIALQGDPRDWKAVEVPASNSVAGPPASVDLSPDGRFAVVIETWTPRPEGDGAHKFGDLKHGVKATVVDLGDPSAPKVVQTLDVPERPDAVRFSPSGDRVAISFHAAGAGSKTPIGIYAFKDGKLGAPTFPAIPNWAAGDRLIDLDWHPSEPVLALLNASGANVRFVSVAADGALAQIGNVVQIEKEPFRVHFTPDGRHIVANGLYWGTDVAGRWIEAPRGSAITVRMNAEVKDDGTARHALVSRIQTGVSPEGLAVSPDGKWIATTNLERSYLPYEDGRITWYSSVTLARLDPATGQLSKVGDFSYDGILPEAAVFDNSSRFLAVVTYDHFDDRRIGGSVDFWRITTDPLDAANVQLIKTEHSVPVTRGAHSLVIAR